MKNALLLLAAVVLRAAMKAASPLIREFVKDKLNELKERAAETPNKFDDILADTLYDVIVGDD